MTAARRQPGVLMRRHRGARAVARFSYGCMKLRVGASDAGSIPATSTTEGVHGFDGALIRDGQPAMVPAASGSPVSRGPVRWAKTKLPTTTAITSSALRDVPAGRGVTNAGTLGGSNALKPQHTHASPTHEPRHAANYGDGWHPLNAPRLKPAQAGLKHGTSPRTPPRTPPRHGWQDIQAGSTQVKAR